MKKDKKIITGVALLALGILVVYLFTSEKNEPESLADMAQPFQNQQEQSEFIHAFSVLYPIGKKPSVGDKIETSTSTYSYQPDKTWAILKR